MIKFFKTLLMEGGFNVKTEFTYPFKDRIEFLTQPIDERTMP